MKRKSLEAAKKHGMPQDLFHGVKDKDVDAESGSDGVDSSEKSESDGEDSSAGSDINDNDTSESTTSNEEKEESESSTTKGNKDGNATKVPDTVYQVHEESEDGVTCDTISTVTLQQCTDTKNTTNGTKGW
jgi:hypothetical protein